MIGAIPARRGVPLWLCAASITITILRNRSLAVGSTHSSEGTPISLPWIAAHDCGGEFRMTAAPKQRGKA